LKTEVTTAHGRGTVSVQGKYTLPATGLPLTTTVLDVKLSTQQLDVAHFWPYYRRHVPFAQVLGLVDVDTSFTGQLADFSAKGKLAINGLTFDYQPVFHAVLKPKQLRLGYQLQVSPQAVNVQAFDLLVDSLHFKGSCAITGLNGKDPRITASATSAPLDLARYNAYIPYGIITKDVSEYIEQHIKGGMLQLDTGRLDGTISQIANMGIGTNYNVLYISARITDGIVSYGPTVPAFNAVAGRLELRGKDFTLTGMSGKFGTSPLTMEGKITDYPPTPAPCTFPFTMKISPRQAEAAWLLGPARGKVLSLSGEAPLILSGEGTTSQYTLTGNWQLSQATYALPDIVQKPAGKNNSLAFKATITKQDLLLHSISYSLGPLQLSLSGKWPFATTTAVSTFTVGSNRFPAQEVAPMLPALKAYQPAGFVQASMSAVGPGISPSDLLWKGTITLNGFGFTPTENIKALRGITGILHLNGKSLETAQVSTTIGSTSISGKGAYHWGEEPAGSIVFSSPRIVPADFGFAASGATPLTISRVQGNLSYKGKQLAIKQLSGQINKSFLTIRGTYTSQGEQSAALTANATYLELADIIALARLESVPKNSGKLTPTKPFHLTTMVTADSGLLGNIQFTRLHAQAELKDSILYLQPFEFHAYGGKVQGKSRLDFGAATPRYQASGNATQIDARTLLADLGSNSKPLAGTVTLHADITGKGNSFEECKQTALGTAILTIKEGSINRFPILSKVFSILNVSQLLKMQLPDMVSGGMPFNAITAHFAIADGIITTNDLYLASDAMNISAVGSLNLKKNELNATIGVQPLQTIDKVVSRIPIVGWILTGKDRTFITTYFEAKGRVDDPQVSAIPVKSITKGTLDIFKRLFAMPAKLITDTGEVLLNR
jgi:hypothetical protein